VFHFFDLRFSFTAFKMRKSSGYFRSSANKKAIGIKLNGFAIFLMQID